MTTRRWGGRGRGCGIRGEAGARCPCSCSHPRPPPEESRASPPNRKEGPCAVTAQPGRWLCHRAWTPRPPGMPGCRYPGLSVPPRRARPLRPPGHLCCGPSGPSGPLTWPVGFRPSAFPSPPSPLSLEDYYRVKSVGSGGDLPTAGVGKRSPSRWRTPTATGGEWSGPLRPTRRPRSGGSRRRRRDDRVGRGRPTRLPSRDTNHWPGITARSGTPLKRLVEAGTQGNPSPEGRWWCGRTGGLPLPPPAIVTDFERRHGRRSRGRLDWFRSGRTDSPSPPGSGRSGATLGALPRARGGERRPPELTRLGLSSRATSAGSKGTRAPITLNR